MKFKASEFFLSLLLAIATANVAFAQADSPQPQADKKPAVEIPTLSVKLFEINYKDPVSLANALNALGSGVHGSMIMPNSQLHTLTVRDLPENIAAIDEALKRLDVPGKSPVSLECQLHLISASMTE